ncbi:hypothetical protein N9H39_03825, partial [Gammaproteobacteria bacterium]|nr:hypothetical protein [Gammaproteobacteria bacterium]
AVGTENSRRFLGGGNSGIKFLLGVIENLHFFDVHLIYIKSFFPRTAHSATKPLKERAGVLIRT